MNERCTVTGLAILLYVCVSSNATLCPLGMQDGRIRADQLSATTDEDNVNKARLFGDDAWGNTRERVSPSITVTFNAPISIAAIATQGKPGAEEYVTDYGVYMEVNEDAWYDVYEGNMDGDTPVRHIFTQPRTTREITIFQEECSKRCALRFELYETCVTTTKLPSSSTTIKKMTTSTKNTHSSLFSISYKMTTSAGNRRPITRTDRATSTGKSLSTNNHTGTVSRSPTPVEHIVISVLGIAVTILAVALFVVVVRSTVSSGLNSLAAVVAEDVVKPFFNSSETKYTWITKGLALGYGILSILMAYVAASMGDVLSAALSIFGMIGGPLLGLFSLAMLFPWCNSIGAAVGLVAGLGFSFWVGIGAIVNPPPGSKLFLTTENCTFPTTTPIPYTHTSTLQPMTSPWTPEPATGLESWWYGMSYLWYSGVAVGAVFIFGITTSLLTGVQKPSELDPGLISPVFDIFFCCLPAKWRRVLWCGVRHDEADKLPEKKDPQSELHVVKEHPNDYKSPSDIDITMIATSDIGVGTEQDKEYFRKKKDTIESIDESDKEHVVTANGDVEDTTKL